MLGKKQIMRGTRRGRRGNGLSDTARGAASWTSDHFSNITFLDRIGRSAFAPVQQAHNRIYGKNRFSSRETSSDFSADKIFLACSIKSFCFLSRAGGKLANTETAVNRTEGSGSLSPLRRYTEDF